MILATPLALFALCEGVARLQPPPDDAFLALRGDPVFFERFERDREPWVRLAHDELYGTGSLAFPIEKPANTLRVFAVGGSASAGWPQPPSESYARQLEYALGRAFPGRRVEVFDASAHAWAAYRVRLVLREALEFGPDLVVIYSGNNEFLEPRRYLPDIALPVEIRRLASIRWLRRLLLPIVRPDAVLAAGRREHTTFEVWSKLRQHALELRSDPVQLERVRDHYAESIEGMLREAGAVGVEVVLVTVPVNLRDWEPIVSSPPPSGEAGVAWRERLVQGRRALANGLASEALAALRDAVALAPDHADTRFWLARALDRAGRFEEAVRVYREAADLDQNPFRALSGFNATLRRQAERYAHVQLADVDSGFLASSAPRAPGFDLFLDYVHPTARGNVLVAKLVYDAVLESSVADARGTTLAFTPSPQRSYDVKSDPNAQRTLFMLFAMMHQHEALVDRARHYAQLADPDWRFARVWLGVFEPLVEIERRRVAGEVISNAELARANRRLEVFYARQYPRALLHD